MRVRRVVALLITIVYIVLVCVTELSHFGSVVVDPVMARVTTNAQLRVGYDPGIWPFTTIINDTPAGYDIDLMRYVARDLGVQAVFVPTSLDAAYDELQQGHIDVMVSAMPYAPEQGWRARFSQFYFDDGLVVVAHAPIPDYATLAQTRVGVVFGADADTALRQQMRNGRTFQIVHYDTLTELWTALECAQIDVVVVEQSYARAMQQQDPTLRVGMALTFAPYVVVLPYDALYLNDALNRSLQRADDTGMLTALAARWMSMPPVICPSP